ncbi:hypothetical protein [Thalassomonas actiniarum]|uniref:Uncharacterized protein n=1 Tax=Thalassomonas actiniarum TaxID=485447 RepID=A0AAF0C381_9GAMM|nr:hypothetical protein [Thalassomonas actiniarum]WDD98693.1 hypothetical protein SG35_026200 [Thalassomonas actiniarum]
MAKNTKKDCFIIMPIADVDGYASGHFGHVYENIIKPSCDLAGYNSLRADEVKETNLIHLDILKKLIEAPMAICDLSNRNPNVLFELGIRQAFDKPVVLIQEKGTPKIFDIAPLRYIEYSKEMKYHEVLNMQQELKSSLEATAAAESDTTNINSIVKLLALNTPAQLPDLENGKESMALEYLQAEMQDMRKMVEISMMESKNPRRRGSISAYEYERISKEVEKLTDNMARTKIPDAERHNRLNMLMREAEELMMHCVEKADHMHFRRLIERIKRAEA